MDFKEETEKLLELLKLEGVDRRKIEKDLRKSQFYIDSTLSVGSNKKFLNELTAYYTNKKFLPPKEISMEERALIQVLLLEMAKVKSKIYGISIDDAIDELEKSARLAAKQLKR